MYVFLVGVCLFFPSVCVYFALCQSIANFHIAPDKAFFFMFFFFQPKVLIFFLFDHKTYLVDIYQKCLTGTLLVSTHNICFYVQI